MFRDLLIGVTDFFRDPAAFAALETLVMPKLFARQGAGGRGARLGRRLRNRRGGLFDCDSAARAHGRAGQRRPRCRSSPPTSTRPRWALPARRAIRRTWSNEVSAERLNRFFVPEAGSYTLAKELRDMCIFSAHSVIRDPPFSRLDLISCRNLLIYLKPALQAQVYSDVSLCLAGGRPSFPRAVGERCPTQ